jgi:hypothetical protein
VQRNTRRLRPSAARSPCVATRAGLRLSSQAARAECRPRTRLGRSINRAKGTARRGRFTPPKGASGRGGGLSLVLLFEVVAEDLVGQLRSRDAGSERAAVVGAPRRGCRRRRCRCPGSRCSFLPRWGVHCCRRIGGQVRYRPKSRAAWASTLWLLSATKETSWRGWRPRRSAGRGQADAFRVHQTTFPPSACQSTPQAVAACATVRRTQSGSSLRSEGAGCNIGERSS